MAPWNVLFTFDATGLEGKSVVVFETLFQGETEIAGHEDIEDEGQTVNFVEKPKIGTTATVDGQHTAEPTGEITIVDVVAYSGLTPGETYKMSGVLMDKATGEPLLVGEEQAQVTAEVEFTPESSDGTVELTYTLDAGSLAGTSIVVFETLYSDGVWRLPPTRISTMKPDCGNHGTGEAHLGYHRHCGRQAHR